MRAAYVESSALVKLATNEAESEELRAMLVLDDLLVTSHLTAVEVVRAGARADGDAGRALARAALTRFSTIPVDHGVLDSAARLVPDSLRSLDAIHVATALAVDDGDLVFYSYDRRTLEAARANGLRTASPGAAD